MKMNGIEALHMAMKDENLVVSYDGGPKVSYKECKKNISHLSNGRCLFDDKWEVFLKEEVIEKIKKFHDNLDTRI